VQNRQCNEIKDASSPEGKGETTRARRGGGERKGKWAGKRPAADWYGIGRGLEACGGK